MRRLKLFKKVWPKLLIVILVLSNIGAFIVVSQGNYLVKKVYAASGPGSCSPCKIRVSQRKHVCENVLPGKLVKSLKKLKGYQEVGDRHPKE